MNRRTASSNHSASEAVIRVPSAECAMTYPFGTDLGLKRRSSTQMQHVGEFVSPTATEQPIASASLAAAAICLAVASRGMATLGQTGSHQITFAYGSPNFCRNRSAN